MHFTTVFAISISLTLECSAETLKIGGIFSKHETHKLLAFELAVTRLNDLNPGGSDRYYMAVPRIAEVNNPFHVFHATCTLIQEGVVAILGPAREENSNVVQSICDDKDIPLLDVRWDDQLITPVISIYPYQQILTQVYIDLLEAWNYNEFVILYENNDSLKRINQLLTLKQYKILIRQLDSSGIGEYRETLKEILRSGITKIVLDCSLAILEEVLRQAQQVGLITYKQSYLITNLDLHTVNLTSFCHAGTNITGMRFIDPDSESMKQFAVEMSEELAEKFAMEMAEQPPTDIEELAWSLQLDTILVYDMVSMFGETLKQLPKNFRVPNMTCDTDEIWEFGTTLINLIKGIKFHGLTGHIQFDNFGYRSDFGLEIIELREGGITAIGNWTTKARLNISTMYKYDGNMDEHSLVNKTFIVITTLTEPYGMRKESSTPLVGNDRYEGYAIDLIKELANLLGFNYTFIIREDKNNGQYDESTGKWSGMIGDIQAGIADLAITDLSITHDRESAVDFTSPFMNLGISILYQKAKKAPPSFFSFADPFAFDVWKLLATAFFVVSCSMFVLGRISPAEWQNPYPCIEEPEFLVNQLSFRNCLWFMTGSIMQQGSEIAPIAVSTRMVAGVWWFATMIMVASYTANLAAFLTTESADLPFNDVFELVKVAEEKGIKYGAKENGSTFNFFKESKIPEYQQIYEYMKENGREVIMTDNKYGVLKANEENYAFFMESTSIEYEEQRKCNLQAVGGLLDEKGYGIAMRKNSTYRGILSSAVLKLQERGVLDRLKRKWWEERRGGGQCITKENSNEATPLNLKNVGGVFCVTIVGSLLSCITGIIELSVYVFKLSIRNKQQFWPLFIQELKFYLKFSGHVKPVFHNCAEKSPESDGQTKESPDSYGFVATITSKQA